MVLALLFRKSKKSLYYTYNKEKNPKKSLDIRAVM